jgi:hypothetical protein
MLLKILARILTKHLGLHLVVPLIVGLLFHAVAVHVARHISWWNSLSELWSFESIVFVAGALLAYIIIMYFLIRRETSARIHGTDLAVLDSVMSEAASYFSTSTISMQEWFDPISQVFLSSIIKRKLQSATFQDQRILLFWRRGELDDLQSMFLDGYYARRLSEIHIQYGTPVAYLSRQEIIEVVRKLPPEDKKRLGCSTNPVISKLWPSLRQLDFALVVSKNGAKHVLRVSKKGQNVHIDRVPEDHVVSYEFVLRLIKDIIYKRGTMQFDEAHDFTRFFCPLKSP